MSRRVKRMVMDELLRQLSGVREILVVDSSRIDANTANRLRGELRKGDIRALTVKNAIARKALSEIGVDSLGVALTGPSMLIWGCEDIVSLSKAIAKWAKEIGELEIKGGTVEGQALSATDVLTLSKSPGRLELIGQIVSAALSPGATVAASLLGPGAKLASQLKKLSDGDAELET